MYQTSLWKLIKSEPLARLSIAIPALGTLLGSLLMALGSVAGCLVTDMVGLLLGIVVLVALGLKIYWIEHLLSDGEEAEATITSVKDSGGPMITQTTRLEYSYVFEGREYKKNVLVHLADNELLEEATVVLDPRFPDNSIIRELYCVAS